MPSLKKNGLLPVSRRLGGVVDNRARVMITLSTA